MKKNKKKRLAFGAFLNENQEPLAQGAALAGQIVQGSGDPTNKVTSGLGTALNRAGQGAQLGMAFGPLGAGIGAGLGAIEGGIEGITNAKKAEKALVAKSWLNQSAVTNQLLSNTKNAVAKGGKLASKLGVVQGGELNQISPDAVEVKANEPNKTDSVELEDAYVDHNEVIDNKDRVFSDELGFAKYAKRLEKQKNNHPRFSAANQHIDNKLDELFQTQEQTKEGMKQGAKTKKAKGGYLTLSGPFPMKKMTGPGPVKYNFDDGGTLKLGSNYTPKINQNLYRGTNTPPATTDTSPEDPDISNWMNGEDMGSKAQSVDVNKGLTALATFGPNLVSGLAQNRLVGPSVPQLERNVSLQRINPNAQLAEADRDANQSNQLIKNNTAQASDIASATGNILAKRLSNKNAIYGQNQALNAQIQHQEAGLNTGINARNAERTNAYTQGQSEFSNLKQRLTTENVANLSGKMLQQGREKNQMQLDRDKAAYMTQAYKDSGVHDRSMEDILKNDPDMYKRLKTAGFAYGGKLGTREICDEGLLDSPTNIFGLYQKTEPHTNYLDGMKKSTLQRTKENSKAGKSSHKLAKGGYLYGGDPGDKAKLATFKERQAKRDSVREALYNKYPSNFNKVSEGMTDYMLAEPAKYKKLSLGGDFNAGAGETPNDPKPKSPRLSSDDFKRISWKSQGVQDSTGRGSMYQTTYGALNKLNGQAIPTGANPMDQTFVTNPLGLAKLQAQPQPALNIAGSVTPQAGDLAHFAEGGTIGLDESLGDPRHVKQASKAGLSKGGIHIKKSHRGLLHKNLGVPQGQKIPKSKLKVHPGDSPALKKRKIFAQNFGHKR